MDNKKYKIWIENEKLSAQDVVPVAILEAFRTLKLSRVYEPCESKYSIHIPENMFKLLSF